MHWTSGASEAKDRSAAIEEAAAGLDADADLLVAFAAPELADAELSAALRARFPRARLVGATGAGVIGGGRELEGEAAGLSLTAARLPGVELVPVDPEAPALPSGTRGVLLLAEPYANVPALVARLNGATDAPVFGGIASGGTQAGEFALFEGESVRRAGAVALAFVGEGLRIDTLVAQGCKPIGDPMIVVDAEKNAIFRLDRGRALDVLEELHADLGPDDRALFRHALFLGVQMREKKGVYERGDFLVRNLVGVDPERRAIAVDARVDRGHPVVQFHLRDAKTSAEDLKARLAAHEGDAEGALVFSCLGRGRGLYGVPDHDADRIRARFFAERPKPAVPLGGFFCNGEIGPVGGRAYLHGYTASVALFREA